MCSPFAVTHVKPPPSTPGCSDSLCLSLSPPAYRCLQKLSTLFLFLSYAQLLHWCQRRAKLADAGPRHPHGKPQTPSTVCPHACGPIQAHRFQPNPTDGSLASGSKDERNFGDRARHAHHVPPTLWRRQLTSWHLARLQTGLSAHK
jgi:hypothetical protein